MHSWIFLGCQNKQNQRTEENKADKIAKEAVFPLAEYVRIKADGGTFIKIS